MIESLYCEDGSLQNILGALKPWVLPKLKKLYQVCSSATARVKLCRLVAVNRMI